MKKYFLLILCLLIFCITDISNKSMAEIDSDKFIITNCCIADLCIGDTIKDVKEKFADYIIKVNESETGYYIFDEQGNFLIEFSTKKDLEEKEAPIRYIMTSNSCFKFVPGDIELDTKISSLIDKYGAPSYQSGPNGYIVTFNDWPIQESMIYKNYNVNIIVGIFNPKLSDLFKFSGTMNEKAEINFLKKYPDTTLLNTIEIYSDYYKDGKPLP